MLSVAVALPIMGSRIDQLRPGGGAAGGGVRLRDSSTVIFGGLFMYFRARGGYRAIQLATDRPLTAGEM